MYDLLLKNTKKNIKILQTAKEILIDKKVANKEIRKLSTQIEDILNILTKVIELDSEKGNILDLRDITENLINYFSKYHKTQLSTVNNCWNLNKQLSISDNYQKLFKQLLNIIKQEEIIKAIEVIIEEAVAIIQKHQAVSIPTRSNGEETEETDTEIQKFTLLKSDSDEEEVEEADRRIFLEDKKEEISPSNTSEDELEQSIISTTDSKNSEAQTEKNKHIQRSFSTGSLSLNNSTAISSYKRQQSFPGANKCSSIILTNFFQNTQPVHKKLSDKNQNITSSVSHSTDTNKKRLSFQTGLPSNTHRPSKLTRSGSICIYKVT